MQSHSSTTIHGTSFFRVCFGYVFISNNYYSFSTLDYHVLSAADGAPKNVMI